MAYSLGIKRETLQYRSYCVVDPDESFEPSRTTKPTLNSKPRLIFTFTGQGAQWPQMGKELYENQLTFRASTEELEKILSVSSNPPTWKLSGKLCR